MTDISEQLTEEQMEQRAHEVVRQAELAAALISGYNQFMTIYDANLISDFKQMDNMDIEGMRSVKLQMFAAEQFGIHLQDIVESGKTARSYLNGEEE